MAKDNRLILRRRHGLGNLLMLFPVLTYHLDRGTAVTLETEPESSAVFSELLPEIEFTTQKIDQAKDLDQITRSNIPSAHRTDEFAEILGAPPGLKPTVLTVPQAWRRDFDRFGEATLFSFEAAHPSRRWPEEHVSRFLEKTIAADRPFVLIGLDKPSGPLGSNDLRGQLSLKELLGLMGAAKGLLTMDSGNLHLAAAVGLPTLALFTAIDPVFRVRPEHRVRVVSTNLDCQPCNKNETCNGDYRCIRNISPEFVFDQIPTLDRLTGLEKIYSC